MPELLQAVDRGDLDELILLDFIAFFNTVDHNILLQRWQQTLASTATHIGGFDLISSVGHSMFVAERSGNSSPICCKE